MKVLRVSDLRTGRLYPRKYLWYSFVLEAESIPGPQCGRNDYVNEKSQRHYQESNARPAGCSAVPQPTAPLHTPNSILYCTKIYIEVYQVMFVIRVFQPKFFRHFSTLQPIPHVPSISSSFMSLPY